MAERTEVEGMAGGSDRGLDDFAVRIEERFDRVDERFDRSGSDVVDLKGRLERIEDRIEMRFGRVEERMDTLGKGLVTSAIALSSGIVACFAAMIVLIATQL